MYITARVGHLHENGRLSERDKPKASSCELDVVFGIPSSQVFPFFLIPSLAFAELAASSSFFYIVHLFIYIFFFTQ